MKAQRRTWIKIFCDKWLRGSMRSEDLSVRAIFIDLLALAGDSAYGDSGEIRLAENVGFTDEVIAGMLYIDIGIWRTVKERLFNHPDPQENRIKLYPLNHGYCITILNWPKYQSEYERQKPYRDGQGVQKSGHKVTNKVTRQVTNEVTKRGRGRVEVEVEGEKKKIKKTTLSASKKQKQTNPDIKKFIDWWYNRFKVKTGEPYLVAGGKDRKLVEKILLTHPYDKLIIIAEQFFNSNDQFIIKAGYNIGVFYTQVNKLVNNKDVWI